MKKHYPDLRRQQIIRDYFNLVSQTAEFRFSIRWDGARSLFAAKGFNPQMIIMMGCDPGDDVLGYFALPDGSAVSCDMKEDRISRQIVSFSRWEPLMCNSNDENDFGLALEIVADNRLTEAFNRAVLAFYDFHLREVDEPLPSA